MKALANIGAALTSFILIALALQRVDPLRGVPDVKAQVDRARRHPAATSVFFGSSLTRRGVDPDIFDKRMAENGIVSDSINCGIDGMTMPEVLFMVDRVQIELPKLQWVILEASAIRTPAPRKDDDDLSKRDIYWRSGKLTWLVMKKTLTSDRTTDNVKEAARSERVAFALRLWLRRFVNLGRIAEFVDLTSRNPKTKATNPLSTIFEGRVVESNERGFLGIDSMMSAKERSDLPGNLARIPLFWNNAREDKVGAEALGQLSNKLRQTGLQMVLVQPPDTKRRPAPYPSLVRNGVVELNFMDPVIYPELYSPEHRYDSRHLNTKGARLFSLTLADALTTTYEARTRVRDAF